MCDKAAQPNPDNVRTEYAGLIDYHNSIVTHRFTLLGFFLAAVGLIAQDGTGALEACLLLVLSFALYTVERRNRVLYEQMSKRAMEIEQNYWGFNRSNQNDKRVPLFHRLRLQALPQKLEEELKGASQAELGEELKEDLDKQLAEKAADRSWKLRGWRFFPKSHTTGLNWVYIAVAGYSICVIVKHCFPEILK